MLMFFCSQNVIFCTIYGYTFQYKTCICTIFVYICSVLFHKAINVRHIWRGSCKVRTCGCSYLEIGLGIGLVSRLVLRVKVRITVMVRIMVRFKTSHSQCICIRIYILPSRHPHIRVKVSNTSGAGNGHFIDLQTTANWIRKAEKT